MSLFQRSVNDSGLDSAVFAPWEENRLGAAPAGAGVLNVSHVSRCLREFGGRLEEVMQRACRIGPGGAGAVVLVAGTVRGAGCSSVALALAAASATQRCTLLLDGDVEQPGLSEQLGHDEPTGWVRKHPPARRFRHPEKHRLLSFLPLSRSAQDRDAFPSQAELRRWMQALRRSHETVVVDGGPAEDAGGRWAPVADVAILVGDARDRTSGEWARAWDCLEEGGAHVLGVVENRAPDGPGPATTRGWPV